MVDSIIAYVKDHPGCEILNRDDPMARRIGFTTTALEGTLTSKFWHRPWVKWGFLGRWFPSLKPKRMEVECWEISLVKLRDSTKEWLSGDKRTTFKEAVSTPSGRAKLAQSLTNSINPFQSVLPQ